MKIRDTNGEWIECRKYRIDPVTREQIEITEEEEKIPKPLRADRKCKWVQYSYVDQMRLARQSRNALLAVQAELFRLHFLAWNKKEPIEFNNSMIRSLGFSHHDKHDALRALETAGWITVQWRSRKSPLVTILRGF
jgi:hypothetical protein